MNGYFQVGISQIHSVFYNQLPHYTLTKRKTGKGGWYGKDCPEIRLFYMSHLIV